MSQEEAYYEQERRPYFEKFLISNKWTKEQIEYLLGLKYDDGTKKVLFTDLEMLLEILSLSKVKSAQEVIDSLRIAQERNELFWSKNVFKKAKELESKEINLQIIELKGVKGIGECRYCGNKKLIFNQLQTRAGDEGMTTIIQCPRCGRSWKRFS
jgi:DNA-directed RNA polymerase subunit M/transcription elongation factor TFIIS